LDGVFHGGKPTDYIPQTGSASVTCKEDRKTMIN
jgi:hypothetical protein